MPTAVTRVKQVKFDTAGSILFAGTGGEGAESSNLFWDNTNSGLAVGHNSPTATAHFKGAGATSATYSLKIENSDASKFLYFRNDGYVGINNAQDAALYIKGIGDTSGTKAFEVINSNADSIFKIQDDRTLTATGLFTINSTTGVDALNVKDNSAVSSIYSRYDGKVGLGTSSLDTSYFVTLSNGIASMVIKNTTTSSYGNLDFKNTNAKIAQTIFTNNYSFGLFVPNQYSTSTDGAGGILSISYGGGGHTWAHNYTAGNADMFLDNSGNLTIASDAPANAVSTVRVLIKAAFDTSTYFALKTQDYLGNPIFYVRSDKKIIYTDGNEASGKLLTSDGSGVGTWQFASSASGTFTTTDLKTVTVSNGIVTSIV